MKEKFAFFDEHVSKGFAVQHKLVLLASAAERVAARRDLRT